MLKDDYYLLRQASPGLKKESYRFEGLPWIQESGGLVRRSPDGWVLKAYHIEGETEVCIIRADGTSITFA